MINVVWSKNAKIELLKTTTYWKKRNKSNSYSEKIKIHLEVAINLIKHKPKLGIKSNKDNIRMRLILKQYYLIYEIKKDELRILRFWDVRQNPINTKFTK